MSQPVFVDASAWVAVTNRKDANHKKSVQIFRRLLGSSTRLIATTCTAYEALTIIKARLGFSQAERFGAISKQGRLLIWSGSSWDAARFSPTTGILSKLAGNLDLL